MYKQKKSIYFSSISKNNSKIESKTNSTICTPHCSREVANASRVGCCRVHNRSTDSQTVSQSVIAINSVASLIDCSDDVCLSVRRALQESRSFSLMPPYCLFPLSATPPPRNLINENGRLEQDVCLDCDGTGAARRGEEASKGTRRPARRQRVIWWTGCVTVGQARPSVGRSVRRSVAWLPARRPPSRRPAAAYKSALKMAPRRSSIAPVTT